MRRVALFAALMAPVPACTLHGDGLQVSVNRQLPGFAAVEVFDDFVARVTVDPALPVADEIAVTVLGEANVLRRLLTLVHGEGVLSVGVDPNQLTELTIPPEMHVQVPTLARGYATDTTTLEISGAHGELTLEAHESATVMLDAAHDLTLGVDATGEAQLTLVGDGPELTLTAADAASVDASGFAAARVAVIANGTGEIRVCATKRVTVRGPGWRQVTIACG